MKASFTARARTGRGFAVQLVLVWLTASLTLGTVAQVLLSHSGGGYPLPLATLPPGELVLVALMLFALAVGLLVVGWRTADATWLHGPRGVLLWTVAVGGFGFAGWFFAAVVALVAEFPHGVLIALVYGGGGLPFALVTGLLQRPLRVNAVAAALVVVALAAGLLVSGVGVFSLLATCFTLLGSLFAPIAGAV